MPIGLLQRSVIGDYPEELTEFAAVTEVPDDAIELDYMIADAALGGRGLGIAEGAMAPDNPIDDPLHYVYRVDRP